MRSSNESQHTVQTTALAFAIVVLAGVAADLVLWPRESLPPVADLPPERFFSAAYIARAQAFRGTQSLLGVAALAALVLVPVLAALFWPRRWVAFGTREGERPVAAFVKVACAVATAALACALPFEFAAFLRARRYGLSVEGSAGWLLRASLADALTLGAVALFAFAAAVALRRLGRAWWAACGVLLIVFAVLYAALAPLVVDPLFANFKPLPAGAARDDVRELARAGGVRTGRIYVVDAASRTRGANAYVTGLGRTKRVVLYDTLLRGFTRAERRQVIAHELAHARYGDTAAGLVWFAFVALASLFAVDLLARALALRRGVAPAAPAYAVMLTAAAMLAVAVAQPAANAYSRRIEARADAFALRLTGDPAAGIALQRRLTVSNLQRPAPPPLLQWVFGTHPAPMRRIGMAYAAPRAPDAQRAGGG